MTPDRPYEETLILEPWEWEGGARECIMVLKEKMKKLGYGWMEVWADQVPGAVHVHVVYPPRNVKNALFRGRT